jgi:hypothetical protein
MSTEIGQYIEYLLRRRGEVYLPGIGSISMIQSPSYFTHGKTKLHPPKLNFEYSEEKLENVDLVQLIAFSEDISAKEAENSVHKYAEKILNDCLNYESALIPGVGYLNKEENTFELFPRESLLLKSLQGLQPIKVEPIRKLTGEILPETATTIKSSGDWITYLGALLLGAFMILSYHYLVDPLGTIQPSNTELSKRNIEKEQNPTSNILEKEQKVNQGQESEPVDLKLLVPNNQDSVAKQDNLRSTSELGIIQQPTKERKQTQDTSGISIAKPKKDQKCIILVGVYNRPIEALVMVDRIKAKGFEPFRDVKFDANRVGVQFNCAEENLEEVLKNVKEKINKDAYVLQPKITI